MVINGNMSRSGNEHYHKNTKAEPPKTYTDSQVAQALEAIVGEGKPIDTKWKWAGAHWLLRFAANYPVKAQDFCDKIGTLPFKGELAYQCDYNNIRPYSKMSFMTEDPQHMNQVRYSRSDESAFMQIRTVAQALERELKRVSADDEDYPLANP